MAQLPKKDIITGVVDLISQLGSLFLSVLDSIGEASKLRRAEHANLVQLQRHFMSTSSITPFLNGFLCRRATLVKSFFGLNQYLTASMIELHIQRQARPGQ